MASSEKGWDHFWQNQKESFNEAMRISTVFFAKRLETLFKLKPTDQIFDYGSGPGFLAEYLETRNIFITSADINKYFIDQIKNHRQSTFIHITADIGTNKRILHDALGEKRFDFMTLLSVIQYFKDIEEVEEVTKLLLPYLSENGRLIIADVISKNTTTFSEGSSLFLQCLKEGKPMTFFRFILYLIFSDYRKHRAQTKLLTMEETQVREIATRHSLELQKIDGLTIHTGRASYVLTKKNIR